MFLPHQQWQEVCDAVPGLTILLQLQSSTGCYENGLILVLQSVAEEISPLITFQMESSVLKGFMDLFTAYVAVLESAITGDTDVMEKEGFSISLPETATQGVFILANLSTLMQFTLSIIRNVFDGIPHLDFEIENHAALVQEIYSRLKSCFLGQFISNIFSPNADHESSPDSRQDSSRYSDLIPSVPYLVCSSSVAFASHSCHSCIIIIS